MGSSDQEEIRWRNVFPDLYDRDGFGVRINEYNALTVSDVFKCVRVRAESLAILPKKVYERVTIAGREGRRPAPKHPLYPLIHGEPNPTMTSYRYFEAGSAHLDTWGNWYSYIERGRNTGRVRALWPLCPHRVRIETEAGQLFYYIGDEQGHEAKFFPDEILHVPGLGYDGVKGYSPVRLMMNAMGWEKSTEQYGVRFFSNSARPSGLLTAPTTLDPDIKKGLKESFEEFHRGTNNAHRVAVLEGGLTWQALTMNQDEAQFIETMKFHRSNLTGMYRVPGWMIGDTDPISDNNVEHLSIHFVTAAVQPPAERIEQEFERALLQESEKGKICIEFELKALMKGDTEARTNHYQKMVGTGIYSQNDCLEEENMPPFEGGDTHWMQLNMAPIDQLIKMAGQAQQQPNPGQTLKQSIKQELQNRFGLAYRSIMRDAVGRLVNRKPQDRERAAPGIFQHILASLAEGLSVVIGEAFRMEYLAALGKRAALWQSDNAESIASDELNRAIGMIAERSPDEEPDQA